MNEIEQLRDLLAEQFPEALLSIDPPEMPSAAWWLDIGLNGSSLMVEWRPGLGFGISTPKGDDFGSGPDELYPGRHEAFARAKELLASWAPASL